MKRLLATVLLWSLIGCQAPEPEPAAVHSSEAVAANNRGVGLMGRFEYEAALAEFEALLKAHPDDYELRLNRSIARKNRQLDGDEASALAEFLALSNEEPADLRASYCAGLLQFRAGEIEAALQRLGSVHAADPGDPHAAYFYGQVLQQAGRDEEARAAYDKAVAADPYLRSAYYAQGMLERRAGRLDEARAALETYQRLGSNPRAQLAEFKYTRMGEKCEVVAIGGSQAPAATKPQGAVFQPPATLELRLQVSAGRDGQSHAISVADIDGDGLLDLFIAGAGAAPDAHNSVLLGQADGTFVALQSHPLASVAEVNASAWGDFDNDGLLDVYLARRGANQLWRQAPAGVWQDVTEATGTTGGNFDTRDAVWLDADHDGDLDLLLAQVDGPNELLNNNLDGSFRGLAAEQGLSGAAVGTRSLLLLDLDRDRDTDLLMLGDGTPHQAYENNLTWQYSPVSGMESLLQQPLQAALAGDPAAEGSVAVFGLDTGGMLNRWAADADGEWKAQALGLSSRSGSVRLQWLDADGDGVDELLIADASGWSVHRLDADSLGKPLAEFSLDDGKLLAMASFSLDDARGPHLVALDDLGYLRLFAPGPGRWPYLRVQMLGAESAADGIRSNRSGIGTSVAARAGSSWAVSDTFRRHAGPGHGLQPLLVGLGAAKKLDFLRLTWSDGVMQTELDLQPGTTHRIIETQRQLSSCPVLFAWDGKDYRFVSDVLGVGGIGFLIAPGTYAESRPWENFLLPEGLLVARDGHFEMKLGEPMEEVGYFDHLELRVFDLPPGWQMSLDERMGTGGEPPTGEPIFYRDAMLPASATMDGVDVLESLREDDLVAAPPGDIDPRFLGRLTRANTLEMEFPAPLDAGSGTPVLLAEGWVEYPYSQTVFSAWQARASYDPPSLSARDSKGNWQLVAERFGYPAGMPRQMALPLPKLPEGSTALRITGNLQVYWDRIRVARSEPLESVHTVLPVRHAAVGFVGFAQRRDGPQRQPHYDYSARKALWDTRHLAGLYTAFGEATELLSAVDGALAIIGPGEELHFTFADELPPLPPGWSRRHVLALRGWAKDMDLYTGDGGTIEPLPGTRNGAAQALHERYNTRYAEGY